MIFPRSRLVIIGFFHSGNFPLIQSFLGTLRTCELALVPTHNYYIVVILVPFLHRGKAVPFDNSSYLHCVFGDEGSKVKVGVVLFTNLHIVGKYVQVGLPMDLTPHR